jgi:hypothetical protein
MTDETVINEIVIEIATDRNNNFRFAPLGQLPIRGRWDFNKVAGRFQHEAMLAVNHVTSIILGECLAVDVKNRTCRLFDPLRETEAGRRMWAGIKPIIEQFKGHFQSGTALREPTVIRDCDEDKLKTWLYYMRRAVDAGHAQVVSNSRLPLLEEIKALPGRREVGMYANTQWSTEKEREDHRWRDVVPLKAVRAARVEA